MNLFENTFTNFYVCEKPKRSPDYISRSGSQYWITDEVIFRYSDHWGFVGTCLWNINNKKPGFICGSSKIEDIVQINKSLDVLSEKAKIFNRLDAEINKRKHLAAIHLDAKKHHLFLASNYAQLRINFLKMCLKSEIKNFLNFDVFLNTKM
jgi:hypothetical protein